MSPGSIGPVVVHPCTCEVRSTRVFFEEAFEDKFNPVLDPCHPRHDSGEGGGEVYKLRDDPIPHMHLSFWNDYVGSPLPFCHSPLIVHSFAGKIPIPRVFLSFISGSFVQRTNFLSYFGLFYPVMQPVLRRVHVKFKILTFIFSKIFLLSTGRRLTHDVSPTKLSCILWLQMPNPTLSPLGWTLDCLPLWEGAIYSFESYSICKSSTVIDVGMLLWWKCVRPVGFSG